jgi:hypothetical protein
VQKLFVLDFDVLCQLAVESFAILLRPNNFDIVNVNSDEEMSSEVDAGIWLQGNEPFCCNNSTEEEIPNAGRLFEPLKGLVEMKDFVRELCFYKAFRLLNVVVVIVSISLPEGVLTIDMEDVKMVCSNNWEDDADGVHSDNGSKDFVEIQAGHLGVAIYNDPYLVLFEIAFRVSFDFE